MLLNPTLPYSNSPIRSPRVIADAQPVCKLARCIPIDPYPVTRNGARVDANHQAAALRKLYDGVFRFANDS